MIKQNKYKKAWWASDVAAGLEENFILVLNRLDRDNGVETWLGKFGRLLQLSAHVRKQPQQHELSEMLIVSSTIHGRWWEISDGTNWEQ